MEGEVKKFRELARQFLSMKGATKNRLMLNSGLGYGVLEKILTTKGSNIGLHKATMRKIVKYNNLHDHVKEGPLQGREIHTYDKGKVTAKELDEVCNKARDMVDKGNWLDSDKPNKSFYNNDPFAINVKKFKSDLAHILRVPVDSIKIVIEIK